MPPKKKKIGRPKGSKKKVPTVNIKVENAINASSDGVTVDETVSPDNIKCKFCFKKFKSVSTCDRHQKKCSQRKISTLRGLTYPKKAAYTCPDCNKKFGFAKSYQNHRINYHSKLPGSVGCDQCSVRCPNKSILDSHIADFHQRQIYECEFCKKQFVRRSHVLRHLAQKGCNGEAVLTYPCEICNAVFTRKDNLRVHLRLQHILRNEHRCKECSFHTRKFSKLIIHVQKHHSESPPQFECDHCGKVTGSRAAIAKHLEIHGERKYVCVVCSYSTYTVEVMRRHVLTHTSDKPYKCAICGNSYIQRLQLQRHLERHAGKTCNECGESFNSKSSLTKHRREHLGLEKLFCPYENCPLANKEFSNESSLSMHVRTHLEEKLYSCEVCEKKFHSEVNMRRHMSTHTLDRPRRCMYCVAARAYIRGEQLVKHVRKTHPAVFQRHLMHVRQVVGVNATLERVSKSELEAILSVLDAESDGILQDYSGEGVLYGGMQEHTESQSEKQTVLVKNEEKPLMNEEELADNLWKLLAHLIDSKTLKCFGWPEETVDVILEKVIEQCGAKVADRERWTRVQRLRENTKHLFLYVIEDKTISRMLDTHTIDQIVKHILSQVVDES